MLIVRSVVYRQQHYQYKTNDTKYTTKGGMGRFIRNVHAHLVKLFCALATLGQVPIKVYGLIQRQSASTVDLHRPSAFHSPSEAVGLLHGRELCHFQSTGTGGDSSDSGHTSKRVGLSLHIVSQQRQWQRCHSHLPQFASRR